MKEEREARDVEQTRSNRQKKEVSDLCGTRPYLHPFPAAQTHVLQYNTAPSTPPLPLDPPETRSRPASIKAFSSAWRQRHSSRFWPMAWVCAAVEVGGGRWAGWWLEGTDEAIAEEGAEVKDGVTQEAAGFDGRCHPSPPLLHRPHPPSPQFLTPLGVPLYPVETTLFSLTNTAPTLLFIQFERREARQARSIK